MDAASSFLTRGAEAACKIIHEAVGLVGPPICPEAGSLFIVDERRLPTWREDGFKYAVGGGGGPRGIAYNDGTCYAAACASGAVGGVGDAMTLTFLARAVNNTEMTLVESTVVVEWALSTSPNGSQRRALRLPRRSDSDDGSGSGVGRIWLVQYLRDDAAPLFAPTGEPGGEEEEEEEGGGGGGGG